MYLSFVLSGNNQIVLKQLYVKLRFCNYIKTSIELLLITKNFNNQVVAKF